MKATLTKALILIALLTSGLIYGQDSQKEIKEPVLIEYDGEKGVFITINFMDLNAEKLLDRKKLLRENNKLYSIISNLDQKESFLLEKEQITLKKLKNITELRDKAEAQISLLNSSLANQVQITKNNKKKARRNGLLWFSGGLVLGVSALAILIN